MIGPRRLARLALALALAPGPSAAFQLDLSPVGVPRALRSLPPPPALDGAVPGVPAARASAALDRAAAAWSSVEGSWLSFRGPPSGPRVRVVAVAEGWPHDARFVAHTEVADGARPGAIDGATIRLNAQHFRFCEGDCAEGQVPLGPVLLHELGHAVGLGHSGARGAVMAPGLGPSHGRSAPVALADDDRRGVLHLYGGTLPPQPPPAPAPAPAGPRWAWLAAGAAAVHCAWLLKNSKATSDMRKRSASASSGHQ